MNNEKYPENDPEDDPEDEPIENPEDNPEDEDQDESDENKRKFKKRTIPNFPFGTNPFENMDDEEREQMNDQIKKMMGPFGDMFSKAFENMDITKMLGDVFKQVKPEDLAKMMNNEEMMKKIKEQMEGKKGGPKPLVFGLNMKLGPDGVPRFEPFGNIKKQVKKEGKSGIQKEESSYEVQDTREPLTDIIEEDKEVIVVAEMPGCVKDKIELKATFTSITIIGHDEEGIKKFETTLTLPTKINPDHAKANFKNGILEIKLQKLAAASNGKKINID
jgi:HSP20 family protein